MERIIGGKYKLGRKIGGGSFGEIFLGLSLSFGFSSLLFDLKIDASSVCCFRSYARRYLRDRSC